MRTKVRNLITDISLLSVGCLFFWVLLNIQINGKYYLFWQDSDALLIAGTAALSIALIFSIASLASTVFLKKVTQPGRVIISETLLSGLGIPILVLAFLWPLLSEGEIYADEPLVFIRFLELPIGFGVIVYGLVTLVLNIKAPLGVNERRF